MIGQPILDHRGEKPYLGIRIQTPMKGMSAVVTRLFKELSVWATQNGVEVVGPPFLRYHVIAMDADMDIEACIPTLADPPDAGRVSPGVLPAGRYASLVYTGSGYAGNKALVEWAKSNEIAWDRWDDEKGDAFRARYESYLTDPAKEPRRKNWEVEVAIKLR